MKKISEETRREIVARINLVDYIGGFVPLKRSGDHFAGRCPFHDDSSPSFHVWQDHFHCFGCGKSGDVFAYEMARSGAAFPEAVEALASRVGLAVDYGAEDPEKARQREERKRLQSIMEHCGEVYHAQLMSPAGETARAYLRTRGFSEESIQLWKLGLAPRRSFLEDLARKRGWKVEDLRRLGLVRESTSERGFYDFFRGRIMIPIRDERGACIAFAGRIYEAQDKEAPKFINSPESPLYSKSRVLFNYDRARAEITRSGDVVVVEGYMDCSTLVNAGIANCVAVSGTALTPEHLRLLAKSAKRVLLCFDSDKPGQNAAVRTFAMGFPTNLAELLFLAVPQGKDPDDFVRAEGAEAFRGLVAHAKPLLDKVCEFAQNEHPTREGFVRHLKAEVVPIVQKHPDPALREIALERLREFAGLSEARLLLSRSGDTREPENRGSRMERGGSLPTQGESSPAGRPRAFEPPPSQRQEPSFEPRPTPGRSPELLWSVLGPAEIRLVAALIALRGVDVAAAFVQGLEVAGEVLEKASQLGLSSARTESLCAPLLAWLRKGSVTSLVEGAPDDLADMPLVIRGMICIARQERVALEELGLQGWSFQSGNGDCRLHQPRDVLSGVNSAFVNLCVRDAIESGRKGTLPAYVGRLLGELEKQIRWKTLLGLARERDPRSGL